MKIFHFHKLKLLFQHFRCSSFEWLYIEVSNFSKERSKKWVERMPLFSPQMKKHRLEQKLWNHWNPEMVIQKSDIGKFVVILNKKVWLEKMNKKLLCENKQAVSETFHAKWKKLKFYG